MGASLLESVARQAKAAAPGARANVSLLGWRGGLVGESRQTGKQRLARLAPGIRTEWGVGVGWGGVGWVCGGGGLGDLVLCGRS